MKKTFVALAVLGAFVGTASAQSSVALYGLVDVTLINTKGGSRLGGNHSNEVDDGVVYGPGSRWGLRVNEDLGSGLRAGALLEAGFAADTGAQTQGGSVQGIASRLFGRQGYLWLSSESFGELRLGRQYTFDDELLGVNSPFFGTLVLNPAYYNSTAGTIPAARNTRLPMMIDGARVDNAIQYITPNIAGFRLQAMVGLGEGTLNGQPGAGSPTVPRYEGLKINYANGPLNLGASYEMNHSVEGNNNKIWALGGNYDFGPAKLLGGFQTAKSLTNYGIVYYGFPTSPTLNIVPANSAGAAFALDSLRAGTIGVMVPVGLAILGADYTVVRYEGAAGQEAKLGKFALGGTYYLSKLTSVYAAASFATGDLKDSIQEKRVVQVGLRKAF